MAEMRPARAVGEAGSVCHYMHWCWLTVLAFVSSVVAAALSSFLVASCCSMKSLAVKLSSSSGDSCAERLATRWFAFGLAHIV
jgi:hypothetical protein